MAWAVALPGVPRAAHGPAPRSADSAGCAATRESGSRRTSRWPPRWRCRIPPYLYQRAAPPRGAAAALPAPCSALVARSRGRAAIADRLPQIIQAYRSTHSRSSGEPCPPRLEIVQLAATASMAALAGRRTRSATPTIDPPTTPTDLGACEDDGGE